MIAKRTTSPFFSLALIGALVVAGLAPTSAAFSAPTVQFGLSAPNVVTSSVTGEGTATENFEHDALPTSTVLGTYSTSGTVSILPDDDWGGSGSKFLKIDPGASLNIALSEPARYVGFWWGAGDDGNIVKLYGGESEALLATFTTGTLTELLGGATIEDVDGETQKTSDYKRPGSANQPFAYVNLQLSDSEATFSRVEFSHDAAKSGGFELDNVTVSTSWGQATAATRESSAEVSASSEDDETPAVSGVPIVIPGTGFETGLDGWTTSSLTTDPFPESISGTGRGAGVISGPVTWNSPGVVGLVGACEPEDNTSGEWVFGPADTKAGALSARGATFAEAVAALLGASFDRTIISDSIVSINPSCPPGDGPDFGDAAWMKKTVTLNAGVTYQMAWNYIATDYVPFNDGSFTTLVPTDENCINCVSINRKDRTWALLGFTTPGTGDYSTGSHGSTGWQIAEYRVTETGDYVLGFASLNLGDDIGSPVLLIDDSRGTAFRDGVAFGGVAPNDPDLPSVLDPPAATVAGSPTVGSVNSRDGGLEVVFTAPVSDGGASITNYEYTVDGGVNWIAFSPAQTTSPLFISGLTGGTSYSVRIRAVNSEGSGTESNAVSGTPTLVIPQTPAGGDGGTGSRPAVQQTVGPLAPQTPRLVTLPPQPPVQSPVLQNNQPPQPPSNPQALVNGVPTQVSTLVTDPNNLNIRTGVLNIGINVQSDQGLVRQATNGETEVQVRSGGVTGFQGSGLAPRSFVQVFLPLQGTNARELARIPVDENGLFNGEAVFATSLQDAPLPIGRQVLQMVTVDEQGRQTVVEFTVNIVQPPPSPELNREQGQTPQLRPGQSLVTNGGIPEVALVTALQDEKQAIIEGDGWVMAVDVNNPNGKVKETEDGGVLLELVREGETKVSGDGFMPGTRADVWLFSEPTLLGTVEVDENGRFSGSVPIDGQMVAVGEHTLQLQGVGMDGYVRAANLGVVVNDEEALAQATAEAAGGFLWWLLALVAVVGVAVAAGYLWWRRRQGLAV